MALTKNALIRYQTLDRCFRNPGKKYFYPNLLDACNEALYNYDKSEGIEERQLKYDIAFMESEQGWSIDLEKFRDGRKVYLRYKDIDFSINNQPINELEAEQLKSAMLVLSRFKGLPQFEWVNEIIPKLDQSFKLSNQSQEIISFDTNQFLIGTEFISTIFNAILYQQTLEVSYQSFKSTNPNTLIFHPYLLKQFNNRWFLFGKSEGFDTITNLALDRILNIKESNLKYQPNKDKDFNEYFEDIIGVSKSDDELLKIIFNASLAIAPYIKTKPLHGSQRKIEDTINGYIFSIEVKPNYELEKMILSFGEDLTVLEPEKFKCKIKERLAKNLNNYNKCN